MESKRNRKAIPSRYSTEKPQGFCLLGESQQPTCLKNWLSKLHNTVSKDALITALTLIIENELTAQRVFQLSVRRTLVLPGLGKVQQLRVIGQVVALLLHFQFRSGLTLKLKTVRLGRCFWEVLGEFWLPWQLKKLCISKFVVSIRLYYSLDEGLYEWRQSLRLNSYFGTISALQSLAFRRD